MTAPRLVHPSNLLRSSSRERVFTAPRNINSGIDNTFDWGIVQIPFTSKMFLKYANISVFVSLMAILCFLQGICYGYYVNTSNIWMKQFRINSYNKDILINSFHVFFGVFGVLIAYVGNITHRVSWIAGLAIIHSISAMSLIVPEWYHPSYANFDAKAVSNQDILCVTNISYNTESSLAGKSFIAGLFLMIHQLIFSLSLSASISLGISYIDDHVRPKNSAIFICILYCSLEFGRQIGLYYSYVPTYFQGHVFLSPTWLTTGSLLFVIGTCISMFPKELPSKILERGVASILDLTIDNESTSGINGVLNGLKLILSNRVIWLTTISAAIMSVAVRNYEYMKKDLTRVKISDGMGTAFSSYSEPSISIFFTNFIEQTFKIVWSITMTAIITKYKPNFKTLVIWISSNYIKVGILFIVGIFMKCRNVIYTDNDRFASFCNLKCKCSLDDFYPICIRGKQNITFYSPCYAGCLAKNGDTYQSCSCYAGIATAGYCEADNCTIIWFISEANNVVRSGLLASTIIMNIFIILKSSPKSYKAIGIGLYLSILQLTPFMPFKFLYDLIRDVSCVHFNYNRVCTIYNPHFPMFMDIITVLLLAISAMVSLMLLCIKTRINFYNSDRSMDIRMTDISEPRDNNKTNEIIESNTQPSTYTDDDIDGILRELEDSEGILNLEAFEDEGNENTNRLTTTSL